jgi:hypothetical protein
MADSRSRQLRVASAGLAEAGAEGGGGHGSHGARLSMFTRLRRQLGSLGFRRIFFASACVDWWPTAVWDVWLLKQHIARDETLARESPVSAWAAQRKLAECLRS